MAKKQHIDNVTKILGMVGKNANKYRLEGMAKALDILKAGGQEALEHEVKFRNAYFVPLEISEDAAMDILATTVKQQYSDLQDLIIVEACMALYDEFGFREKRLNRFVRKVNYHTDGTTSRDENGEHFVKVKDFAQFLNDNCKAHFDVDRIKFLGDEEDRAYEMDKS